MLVFWNKLILVYLFSWTNIPQFERSTSTDDSFEIFDSFYILSCFFSVSFWIRGYLKPRLKASSLKISFLNVDNLEFWLLLIPCYLFFSSPIKGLTCNHFIISSFRLMPKRLSQERINKFLSPREVEIPILA